MSRGALDFTQSQKIRFLMVVSKSLIVELKSETFLITHRVKMAFFCFNLDVFGLNVINSKIQYL